MKRNFMPKQAQFLLIAGLLLTTLTPMIGRHMPIPDFVKGLVTGLGLTLEFIALVKIQRSNNRKCAW